MNFPNHDKQNSMKNHDTESDLQLEEALSNFRHGMRAWSDRELTRRPAMPVSLPARSPWHWMMAPAVSWAAAAALTLAAVGVPLGLHYRNAAPADARATVVHQNPPPQTQPASQAADTKTETKAEDDQLLDHVDTDIAQDTPDAMQPLASLMSSSSGNESSSGAN